VVRITLFRPDGTREQIPNLGDRFMRVMGNLSSRVRVLSRRTIPGCILKSRAYFAAMKSHVSQLPIAEIAQDGQARLMFAVGDECRDPPVDAIKKPSADEAGAPSNE
jgi:hypothetical protein